MSHFRRSRLGHGGQSRLWTLCIWTTWVHVAATLPPAVSYTAITTITTEGLIEAASFAIIPSAPRGTILIPSAPIRSSPIRTALIPSGPPSSDEPSSDASSTSDQPAPETATTLPPANVTEMIPSSLLPSIPRSTAPGVSPTFMFPLPPNGTIIVSGTNVAPTLPGGAPGMTSTEEGLHPIPAPTIEPGDPDGHHEIPEPNFSTTLPCRGCSPVIEVTATGWDSVPTFPLPPAQEQESKPNAPVATLTAAPPAPGPSDVLVKPGSSGGDFIIGGSTRVKPGQTVTVGGTPIVVQTSAGRTEVIIGGTRTIPLQPVNNPPIATITAGSSPLIIKPAPSGSTPAPIFLPIPLAPGQTLTPILPSPSSPPLTPPIPLFYILASHTLLPNGPPLTLSLTTYTLLSPSTLVLQNTHITKTLTLHPTPAVAVLAPAPLTLWSTTFTPNAAGAYVLAPDATLVPGGPAVTVSGEVVSLEAGGTVAVIQGSRSVVPWVTDVVTVVKGTGMGGGGGEGKGGRETGVLAPLPLPKPTGGVGRRGGFGVGCVEGVGLVGGILVAGIGAWL